MDALLLVDIQNDFMPFGALPVAEGHEVVPVANLLAPRFELVIATQDWHPSDHVSFASNQPGHVPGDVIEIDMIGQVLWPDHCVQQMPGASFHSALDVAEIDFVVRKGTDPRIDSYSGFFDNEHLKETGLERLLRDQGVNGIVICGLTTDYCVLSTALDGRELGFDVTVVGDGVRAVNLTPGDSDRAFERMRAAGCTIVSAAAFGV